MIAVTDTASVDFLPNCDSTAPLIGASNFSTEPVIPLKAARRKSTAALYCC